MEIYAILWLISIVPGEDPEAVFVQEFTSITSCNNAKGLYEEMGLPVTLECELYKEPGITI